jgi:hypothetical protein
VMIEGLGAGKTINKLPYTHIVFCGGCKGGSELCQDGYSSRVTQNAPTHAQRLGSQ